MSRFTKITYAKLKQAGWFPNRRVSIETTISELNKMGYFINDTIQEFLNEFEGLCLDYIDGNEQFDFTPLYTSYSQEYFNQINNSIGSYSLKVGTFYNGYYLIAINEEGKLFALNEGLTKTFIIGQYIDEGIEFICKHGMNPHNYLQTF